MNKKLKSKIINTIRKFKKTYWAGVQGNITYVVNDAIVDDLGVKIFEVVKKDIGKMKPIRFMNIWLEENGYIKRDSVGACSCCQGDCDGLIIKERDGE